MHHPTDRIIHTTAFVTPVVEHWLEREIAQWVHPMKDRSDHPSHHERTFLPRSYISLYRPLDYIKQSRSQDMKRLIIYFFGVLPPPPPKMEFLDPPLYTHTYIILVEYWLSREIAEWVQWGLELTIHRTMKGCYISFQLKKCFCFVECIFNMVS